MKMGLEISIYDTRMDYFKLLEEKIKSNTVFEKVLRGEGQILRFFIVVVWMEKCQHDTV